tara:strand:- start:1622 stop:2698 length:1077 start_codon:yes stop_codon:yes gene_type:complete
MSTKKIVLAIIFNSIIVSQTISNQGMFIMSSLINNDIPDHWSPYELSIIYIPALSLKKKLSDDKLVDAEWAYHLGRHYSGDSLFNYTGNNHRLWIRYASDKIEARLGLQKIVFGPTQILRPLSWFDTFDLKDPTGRTNGVESFRLRWFPSNNIAIWSWMVNNDVDTLSFGGRAEVTSSFGEFGFTYHEDPSKSKQLIGQTGIPVFNSQKRVAFDYRFDGFIGFWNESVLIKSDRSNLRLVSIGADYTLPVFNGILIMTESMHTQNKYNNIQSNQNFSAFMASLPIGMIHQAMYISQIDWKENKTYQYLRWISTYDAYSLNMIISMNPKRKQYDIPLSSLPKSLSGFGTGIQFMFIYNH